MPFENNLWTWYRDGNKDLLAQRALHLCRVENSVSTGYPDVEACYLGHNFHLELKGALRPARPSTRVDIEIRQDQILWLRKRWKVGGAAFVLLRVGTRTKIQRYLIKGNEAHILKDSTEAQILKASLINPNFSAADITIYASHYRKDSLLK